MKTIELRITETGRENLKVPAECFNTIHKSFETKGDLKDFLKDHYGKIPKGKIKIYRDKKNAPKSIIVGFCHSFWNQDVSHASKKWYQTDWIEFWEETTTRTYFEL